MRLLLLSFLLMIKVFGGTIEEPTAISVGEINSFDENISNNYYSFSMAETGNLFILNPDPKESHSYRIYDKEFNLIESDIVIDSKVESLYKGEYLYHNVKGSFSVHSNKLK